MFASMCDFHILCLLFHLLPLVSKLNSQEAGGQVAWTDEGEVDPGLSRMETEAGVRFPPSASVPYSTDAWKDLPAALAPLLAFVEIYVYKFT